MSFAQDVKAELCKVENTIPSKRAEAYGLLLFGRSFGPKSIVLQTEHTLVAQKVQDIMTLLTGEKPVIREAKRSDGHKLDILAVDDQRAAEKIYHLFGYSEKTVSLRINFANIEDEESAHSFLRGIFLACGSVVDPGKDYHLEFVTPHLNLSRDLLFFLQDIGFEPKMVKRKGNSVIYFKDSAQIEDILTLMGAAKKSLELMNIKVYKDLRNKVNRVTNCETANIGKIVNASAGQVEAIKKLIKEHGYGCLPEELREVARLRLENPEMSLRELGAKLRSPLSRSGVNHRLKKVMELAGNENKRDDRTNGRQL